MVSGRYSDRAAGLVVYDGQWPLCLKSVATLRRLDWLGQLRYQNARDKGAISLLQPPLQGAQLLEEMHLLTPGGRVYRGFEALRWIAWRLPLLWALAPLLYLPGVPASGQRVYRWIARNRFRLVPCHGGVCSAPGRQTPRLPP
jgi:predicted DCC family thiol-disulfide oxidoreductase YuxK